MVIILAVFPALVGGVLAVRAARRHDLLNFVGFLFAIPIIELALFGELHHNQGLLAGALACAIVSAITALILRRRG